MKKFFSLFLAISFVGLSPVFADNNWIPTGSFSVTWQEKYLGAGIPENFHDDPMIWDCLRLNLPKDFFLETWHSYGLDDNDFSSNYGDEVDLTIGWNKTVGNYMFLFSVGYWNLHPLENWNDKDVLAPIFSVSRNFAIAENHSLSAGVQFDFIGAINDFDNGAIAILPSITHRWEKVFQSDLISFSHTLGLMWMTGGEKMAITEADDLTVKYSAGTDWNISKNFFITAPGIIIMAPLTNDSGTRSFVTSFNFSVNFKF